MVKCNLEGKKGRKGKTIFLSLKQFRRAVDKNYEKVRMCKGLRGCEDKNNKPR